MDHLDTSWCPVCDRQILPKRITVPVAPAATPAPAVAAPPASEAALPPKPPAPTRTKSNGGRPRGLVHGTGRVKPNGTIKRATKKESPPTAPAPAPVATPAAAPAPPAPAVKTRTVIDQSPIPLYCSDECRLADLHNVEGFALDYNPDRHPSPHALAVPATCTGSHGQEDAASSTSDSDTASTTSSSYTHASARSYREMDPSIATLAAIYGFPALGPPPPLLPDVAPREEVSPAAEFQTGIIMAGRRLDAIINPPAPKRAGFSSPTARITNNMIKRDRKPIPGWTDGSDAWRAALYSFSAPKDWTVHDPKHPDNQSRAYSTFVATSHRAGGVYSTLGEGKAATHGPSSVPPQAYVQDLYENYPLASSRRSESRQSMFAPSSLPTRTGSAMSRRRDSSLCPREAQGKLLVPDVKMRRSTSTASVSSMGSAGMRSPRGLTRRGSSMSEDTISEEGEPFVAARRVPVLGRPPLPTRLSSTRPPSADDLTYPVPLVMTREKRIEKRVVDGVETEVEVEVSVPKELKRLFLGPDGKSEQRERRRREAALAMSKA